MTEPTYHNEISGVVHGTVIQAGTVSVSLQVAHRQLAVGQRAERRTAALVSILYVALARAFRLVGELIQNGEAEGRIAAARSAHDRTQRHIERAESERERAVRLVSVIGRKIMALQNELLRDAPEEALRLGISDVVVAGHEDLLDDIDTSLDRIERLLDEQDRELTQLERAEWTPSPPRVDVDRLRDILSNESISFAHRIDAARKIAHLGEEYIGDADSHLRLLIMNGSLTHPMRVYAIKALGLFGPRHRAEAAAMMRQQVTDDSNSTLNRIQAAEALHEYEDVDRAFGASLLRRMANGDERPSLRVHAVRAWWKLSPQDRDEIVAVAQGLVALEDPPSAKRSLSDFIQEIQTDPWGQ